MRGEVASEPLFQRVLANGDFTGSSSSAPALVVVPSDGAVLVFADPGGATTLTVEYRNGQAGSFIVRAGRWRRFSGTTTRKLTYAAGIATATWIVTNAGPDETGIWRLNANADTIGVVSPVGGPPQSIPPPTTGTNPSPIVVPLDAIATTTVTVPAAETWEVRGVHANGSASLNATLTITDVGGKITVVRVFPTNNNSDVLPLVGPVHVAGGSTIAVNVTAAGAAGTACEIAYVRVG